MSVHNIDNTCSYLYIDNIIYDQNSKKTFLLIYPPSSPIGYSCTVTALRMSPTV